MTDKLELLPCPFCGEAPYVWQAAGGARFVSCNSDRNDKESCYHQQHRTGGMTPEAWNRRPSPPDLSGDRAGNEPGERWWASMRSEFASGRTQDEWPNLDARGRSKAARAEAFMLASLTPPELGIGDYQLHPKTAALVRRFMSAMAAKLAAAEAKYGYSDGWSDTDWEVECRHQLHHHAAKGDPRDVAAYAAFCWHHGWSTSLPTSFSPNTENDVAMSAPDPQAQQDVGERDQ